MKNWPDKPMTCKQAGLAMALHIANDPDMPEKRHLAFERHLENCPKCTKEYKESKFIIELVKQHWKVSEETLELIEKAGRNYKPKMTVEEGWQDLCQRCPDLAESSKPKSIQLFLHISAAAACLVIGVLTWLVFSNYSKQQIPPQNSSPEQVVSALKPSVKVELVTNTGNVLISSGQQVTSAGQLKTLLINGKHRMMMNINTVLAVEPLIEKSNIGCLVKLASGQIYTHVQHDGNPFVVDTSNGKAVITGTTFDVKATDVSTTLVVSEGTVRFESEKSIVKVAAGQISEITSKSAPSIPLSCNSTELTAWATGYKAGAALAKTELNPDPWDLPLSFGEKPIVLAETDYKQWVEQKREWFKKDFPWIFELKDALAKEGIKADYPELLIKSGDVWQFVCLQKSPAKFSVPDFESLLKVASSYGFDKEWLLKNVLTAKTVQNKSLLLQNPTGLAALEQLLKYVNGTEDTPYYLYPSDACKYLAETRSLIWFAINAGKFNLTDNQRIEVLDLLQQEITAAYKCQNEVLYPPDEQKLSCSENKKVAEFQKNLISNEIVKTWELFSVRYKAKMPLQKFSQMDWVKDAEGRPYISRIKIKTIQPINDKLFVVLFKRTNRVMYFSIDEKGQYWIEDFVLKTINKAKPILPTEISLQEKVVAKKLTIVLENFRLYQKAIYERDLRKQMSFFHRAPATERHFSTWGINKTIAQNEELYKLISKSDDLEFRTNKTEATVTVEIKKFPVIWVWKEEDDGKWKISSLHATDSLDFDTSDLPNFYFTYSVQERDMPKAVEFKSKGDN